MPTYYFPAKCMKMKEFEPGGGACVPSGPLDLPLQIKPRIFVIEVPGHSVANLSHHRFDGLVDSSDMGHFNIRVYITNLHSITCKSLTCVTEKLPSLKSYV